MRKGRAVRIREFGGPEVLEFVDVEPRPPGHGEILVRVEAAGLNRADLLQRRGLYPAPPDAPADVPGLEYAGVVEAAGPGAGWEAGDRVMGIVGGGAMATHVTVSGREAMPIPEGMPAADAAAIPEVFLTAYDALFVQGELRLGETVLVHAVGSGVGTAALQLVRAAGATCIGTSRTEQKLERCRALGLDVGLRTDGRFADEVKRHTGGRGVDLVLDLVGASYLEENLAAVATRGRLVCVGLLGGAKASLPLGTLLQKRVRLVGTVLRSRPPEEKASLTQRFAREVLPLFVQGRLRPVVDTVLPFERVTEAHRLLESNRTFGKIVLTW
ncbi:MAG TPA: NAD(P)H-quinone oxidoreductase [Fredinandcohnia sp.]|nr:NAD(P)H-quinone oxidoreductase [Fredinandcohnia sp.]